ncbi:MAG: pyruvate carboxylase subunit B [Methylacidiphilales bacterium]|nr:pyruvate carboxylase subunit B [Candidatus Methylacidiphilales bacterium]
MISKTVLFNNTVLRDGHQSLAATRMSTAQMLPVAPELDEMGFAGLETWGGAVIDSCLRYLNENPFDRLRALKKAAPKTPQIMLLRGQNIVQYTSFPDDVVEAFVRCTIEAGQDVLRVFDALNDIRNLETAVKAVLKYGAHPRGEICYTTSPVHTVDAFVRLGVGLEKMGCKSIGIKDMAGILQPKVAYDLVRSLKEKVSVPIVLHCHDTAGLGAVSYYAAVEAGVDTIETSIVPFANGTSQPDTVRMLSILEGHPRCPKHFDKAQLQKMREHFEVVYKELGKFTSPANERVDTDTLAYQVPGGMLSNFRNQLKEQGMDGRMEDVLREIPVVREALGWIPLVTPTSQIVGTQAMMNVKFGRWKMISQPSMDVVLGKYGRTPGPVDTQLLEDVIKKTGQKAVEQRPADLLQPRMESLRKELAEKGLPVNDENAVLYAMFPQEVTKFYKPGPAQNGSAGTAAAPAPKAALPAGAARYRLEINGKKHEVTVEAV